jgi:hypothetical protein
VGGRVLFSSRIYLSAVFHGNQLHAEKSDVDFMPFPRSTKESAKNALCSNYLVFKS